MTATIKQRSRRSHSTSGSGNPEAALIARTVVWQALDILPPRRRAIVVMYELEELAIPAIASLLGISAITVRWHLSMGRHELTAHLRFTWGTPMKTIRELLRDADPLRHEPPLLSGQRDFRRQAILAAASGAQTPAGAGSRSRIAFFATVALMVIAASFLGPRVWSVFVSDLQGSRSL